MSDTDTKKDAWTHGATLASSFGMLMEFVSIDVMYGTNENDEEDHHIAVYPKRYAGMGGGALRANMDGMPVFDFEVEDREQADALCKAFNFFALEGRIQ